MKCYRCMQLEKLEWIQLRSSENTRDIMSRDTIDYDVLEDSYLLTSLVSWIIDGTQREKCECKNEQ